MSKNNLGKILSFETRTKMSESRKGHYVSNETKLKISKSLEGKPGGMSGKNHKEESKKKSSLKNKEKHTGKKRVYRDDGSWYFKFKEIT